MVDYWSVVVDYPRSKMWSKPVANIQPENSVVKYFNNYFFTYFLQKPATFTDSQIHVFTGGVRLLGP